MDAVKSFNQELSSLYEVKPPISKAKMTALTRGAIKAIKFYKHVVQSVEKFILKCKPEYKVPGLYVIDSIVRQSRHQFGSDKDVFAPRFSKNMQQTFVNLFKCPPEDKSKIIRVLNLWQKNNVFQPEVIQPLFDLADPNNPIHKEIENAMQQSTNGLNNTTSSIIKGSPALQKTPTKGSQQGNDTLHGATSLNLTDPSVLQQLQQLQRLISKNVENSARSEPVHFDKKLLDFDYGDDDDDVHPSPRPQQPPAESFLPVTSLLTNPEVLRQLQTLQQTMANAVQPQQQDVDMDRMRKMQEMKQQEEEFDKHLAQTVPNLPFASECDFRSNSNHLMVQTNYYIEGMNPPAPQYHSDFDPSSNQGIGDKSHQQSNADVEVITLDHDDSRSISPAEDRYRKRRRSRSRSRDRRRDRRRTRSRSGSRRHRSRSREKDRKKEKEKEREKTKEEKEKESEKERERKKRGLPSIKKDHLSVCSTTLWVGHLSKLVHQDDLSNTFGEFGDVVSIDLIPPRGCAFIVMLRRQDAARCLTKLKGHNLHGKSITLAWAPGKGVKGKDLKDYWEGDLGVSYIPYSKLKQDIDTDMLEDGGMIDEDTMPDWMKEKLDKKAKPELDLTGFVGGGTPNIDTSQPPPIPGAGMLQPPPMMPTFNPFQFNNRLLGMNVPPGMMPNMPNMQSMQNMPNIPIGVPPPSITGPTMMGNQLLGIGSSFQGPPGLMAPQIPTVDNKPPNLASDANLHSLGESLMSLTQSFGVVPQPPAPHEDNMDIEMEDADSKPLDKPATHEQSSGKSNNRDDDRRDSKRDDRDRRNRSRDRDRDNRDRDRDRSRDRHSRDRDRDRDRDRRYRNDRDSSRGRDRDRDRRDDRRDRDRDRSNRWSDRDRRDKDSDREDRRDREKTLNDRLREMAGMGGAYDDRDRRGDRFNRERDQSFKHMPQRNNRPDDDFARERDSKQRDRFDRSDSSRQRNDSSDRNDRKRPEDKSVIEEREVTKIDEKKILVENASKEKEADRDEDNSRSEDEVPPGTEDGGDESEKTSERMEVRKNITETEDSQFGQSQESLRFEAPTFNPPPMFEFPPPFTAPPPFDGPPGVFEPPPMGMFDDRRGGPPRGFFEGGPPMFNDMMRGRGRGRGRGGPMMPMGMNMNMEGPPMMEGPPGMMPFNDRFMRGGRRGGIRGPPPGDFFPGDDFRRGRGRGRGQFFRGRGRGGFNSRFETPPYEGAPFEEIPFDAPFRPQFDGPAGRFRGGPPRPERPWGRQGPEREGRRSRWGGDSPQSEGGEDRSYYNDDPPGVDPGEDEMQQLEDRRENNNDMGYNEPEDHEGREVHGEERGGHEEEGGGHEEEGRGHEDGGGEYGGGSHEQGGEYEGGSHEQGGEYEGGSQEQAGEYEGGSQEQAGEYEGGNHEQGGEYEAGEREYEERQGEYEERQGEYEERQREYEERQEEYGGGGGDYGGGEEREEDGRQQEHHEQYSEDRANTPVEDEMPPPREAEGAVEEADVGNPEATEGQAEAEDSVAE